MPSFTTELAGRDSARRLRFTDEEAMALYDRGFRFSLFQPATGEFHLSLPFRAVIDLEHNKLTIVQEES